ncbi:MAG: acyltransferase family protein [Holophagaceae bacterium]|nr:acyltransferase family protein [Holophagaceae bacterium]
MSNSDYSQQLTHGEYYPHIDGIRALAVLPVVLFHTLAWLCPGGFVGVDVFFVISGYLITGGILRDLGKEKFTIRGFYHRRILRIMPAYFTLILGVFIIGCAIYYCIPLVHLGDASVMGTLFSANLYFWKLGGDYFAPNVHGNPLLHLWSLSVEEQFYLCIPLLCTLVWKFQRQWLFRVFAGLTVLSLATATYLVATGRQGDAFYLPHYRAWELLVGSLLAMLPRAFAENERPMPWAHPWLPALGLALVLVPYALYSSNTPFPGLAASLPVIGTALLIRYGQSGWISRLLSWKPFVAVGKISYSLYLWHWPVAVYWKYVTYDQLNIADYLGIFFVSLLFGYLSWRFIEIPVRTSQIWSPRRSFAFATSGILMLVTFGIACVLSRGWPRVLHPEANGLVVVHKGQFIESFIKNKIKRFGSIIGYEFVLYEPFPFSLGAEGNFHLGVPGEPEIFLIGDSHAGALQYGLDSVLRQSKRSGYVMNRSGKNVFNLKNIEAKDIIETLKKHPQVSKVVMAESWSEMITKRGNQDYQTILDQVEEFTLKIQSMNKTLYIVTDIPIRNYNPIDIAAKMTIIPPRKLKHEWINGLQSEVEYEQRQGYINRQLKNLCHKTGAVLVPMHIALKRENQFIAFEHKNGHIVPLYMDGGHLSPDGSLLASKFIMLYLFPDSNEEEKKTLVARMKPNSPEKCKSK